MTSTPDQAPEGPPPMMDLPPESSPLPHVQEEGVPQETVQEAYREEQRLLNEYMQQQQVQYLLNRCVSLNVHIRLQAENTPQPDDSPEDSVVPSDAPL